MRGQSWLEDRRIAWTLLAKFFTLTHALERPLSAEKLKSILAINKGLFVEHGACICLSHGGERSG